MERTVISDASCIILFEKIGELKLLQDLFDKIIITKKVAGEYGKEIPHWFQIRNPAEKTFRKILSMNVDKGEAEAMALSIDLENTLLIIDDLKGRRIAEKLGIKFIGSLGIIVDAKLQHIIFSIKPFMEKIKRTNFRITEKLERKVYENADESY